MKVSKICDSYREQRGDYEVQLKPGETLRVYGEERLILCGEISNIIMIKCGNKSTKDWVDLKTRRVIVVE